MVTTTASKDRGIAPLRRTFAMVTKGVLTTMVAVSIKGTCGKDIQAAPNHIQAAQNHIQAATPTYSNAHGSNAIALLI